MKNTVIMNATADGIKSLPRPCTGTNDSLGPKQQEKLPLIRFKL